MRMAVNRNKFVDQPDYYNYKNYPTPDRYWQINNSSSLKPANLHQLHLCKFIIIIFW
jgi:hypothetical protein